MAELMNVTQTLSSMEVADMVEKEHHKLMRDIRRYTKQLNESNFGLVENNEGTISPVDFWSESSYEDSKGEQRPCYQITKLGCEFIAHKTTGAKGTAFTAKYIFRFHQMEEELKGGNMMVTGESLSNEDKKQYLAKYSKTWYDKEKWKIDKLCYDYGWDRKYLYHKILKELSDVYNLEVLKDVYYRQTGREPKYDMDLINQFIDLQDMATRYLDFLLDS